MNKGLLVFLVLVYSMPFLVGFLVATVETTDRVQKWLEVRRTARYPGAASVKETARRVWASSFYWIAAVFWPAVFVVAAVKPICQLVKDAI